MENINCYTTRNGNQFVDYPRFPFYRLESGQIRPCSQYARQQNLEHWAHEPAGFMGDAECRSLIIALAHVVEEKIETLLRGWNPEWDVFVSTPSGYIFRDIREAQFVDTARWIPGCYPNEEPYECTSEEWKENEPWPAPEGWYWGSDPAAHSYYALYPEELSADTVGLQGVLFEHPDGNPYIL